MTQQSAYPLSNREIFGAKIFQRVTEYHTGETAFSGVYVSKLDR